MTPRPRERILTNLETVYREAYQRAKELDDKPRMVDLDSSYQREQLLLEVLLDIRDAIHAVGEESDSESAIKRLKKLRDLAKLRK